jgi:hypothetical protein
MPLFEATATAESACISTAPVFLDANAPLPLAATAKGGAPTKSAAAALSGRSPLNRAKANRGRSRSRGRGSGDDAGGGGGTSNASDGGRIEGDVMFPQGTWWSLFPHPTAPTVTPHASVTGGEGSHARWLGTLAWLLWLFFMLGSSLVPVAGGRFVGYAFAVFLASTLLPDDGTTVLPYCMHPFVAILGVKAMHAGGWWAALPAVFIFFLLPLGDFLVGVDLVNQPAALQQQLQGARRFAALTLSVVPVQLLSIGYGCWYVSRHGAAMGWGEYAGAAWGVGLYSAVSITVGHELCHKV